MGIALLRGGSSRTPAPLTWLPGVEPNQRASSALLLRPWLEALQRCDKDGGHWGTVALQLGFGLYIVSAC